MKKGWLFAFGLVVTALVTLGLVVLMSASGVNAMRLHGSKYFFIERQCLYCVAGIILAAIVASCDYRMWKRHLSMSVLLYLGVLVLLGLVFLFPQVNGSWRWIRLGPLRLQPSEFAKLAAVICTAVYMDRLAWRVETFWKGLVLPGALIVLLAAPIIAEPDFGSTMVLVLAGGLVMFLAGVKLMYIAPFAAIAAAGIGVFVYHNANRMARIFSFLSDTPGTDGANYQVFNSLVAIKNGGLWGVGLNMSMQKQAYLPEAHTDFIFAVGAEEMGIIFSIVVVLLFVAFFVLATRIAARAQDTLGRYLASGMAFIIFFQAMFNLAVVCRALPTKGMALPFFSYGGTNMLAAFFAVGMILSVGIRAVKDKQHERWKK